jgi:hypothetical protein
LTSAASGESSDTVVAEQLRDLATQPADLALTGGVVVDDGLMLGVGDGRFGAHPDTPKKSVSQNASLAIKVCSDSTTPVPL